ncbi:hypothetical protein GCM10010983_09560 [Caulobacter rhizosphaerae]|nr:hypothetical protein GCM10010983_09560 [Caulobacter rhizosphaerae]
MARGLAEQQAGGDALAVRDRGSLTWPARRRLQGGEAPTGFSAAALPDNDRAERSGFVETVYKLKHSGRCPALRVPFHQLSGQPREDERPCLPTLAPT